MNALKPFVIFREDGYYTNLDNFLKTINFPDKDTKITVYVKNDSIIESDFNVEIKEFENLDDYQNLRKEIFSNANESDILILFDSYMKFTEPINYDNLDSTTYIVLKSNIKNIGLPVIFSYNSEDNASLDLICDISYYDTSDDIYGYVDVNPKLFNNSLTINDDDIVLFLVNFLFDMEIVDNGEMPDISETDSQFYYTFIDLFNNKNNAYEDLDNILSNFEDKYCTYLLVKNNYDIDQIKVQSIYRKLFTTEPENCLIYYYGNTIDLIKDFVMTLDKIDSKNLNSLLPKWIEEKHIPEYISDRNLPNITLNSNKTEQHSIIKDFKVYNINNNEFNCNGDKIVFMGEDFTNLVPLEYKSKILYLAFNQNSYKITAISNNKLNTIFDNKPVLEYSNLFGNMIKFFANYICLTKIRDSCYAISVFTDKTFDFKGISKYFRVTNPIGLSCSNNKLFILSKIDNVFYKNEVNLVDYFTDICVMNDINDVFNVKIKLRNNIKLTIKDYENIQEEFSGLRFNAKDEVLANVTFDYENKIIKYNDDYYYHNKFVYLPKNIDNITKEYDICYYRNYSELNDLRNKLNELQISNGNEYKKAKYCFILQSELERLNSLELSDIIESNTIIISILTPQQLANNNFIKKYTVDPLLQKLFLFNIGMNDNYIEFVIEKILMDNQYDKRKEFMAIDKNNIFNNSNIFNIIHKIKSDLFFKKYPEKNKSLLTKFKNKLFKSDTSFENLINYAIDKEFELNIRYLNTSVPENIKKLNIFGTEKSMLDDCSTFDVLVVKKISDLKNIEVSSENVFFYITDINKILIT